jgi:hypothetical protein
MEGEKDRLNSLFELLPEGWEKKAKELGALKRGRKIRTPKDLLWLILLYQTEGKSLAGTAAMAEMAGVAEMSKEAVSKRMKRSKDWLKWLCQNICRRVGLAERKPRWLAGREVKIVDGSEEVKCGVRRKCYMLHYCIELFTLDTCELHVTDNKTGEKLSNFNGFKKGDIVMGDRGYGNLPGIAFLNKLGVDFVLRIQGWKHAFFNEKNEKIDLLARLSVLKEGEMTNITANCTIEGQYKPVRICAMRKSAQSEQDGIKRLTKTNQRKHGGVPVSGTQQENNKYVILATSLEEGITAAQIMELYRMRRQIEMAFKRLKSLFKYNDLPMEDSESAFAWFYGKLLLAALCETLVNTGRFSPCGASGKRNQSAS